MTYLLIVKCLVNCATIVTKNSLIVRQLQTFLWKNNSPCIFNFLSPFKPSLDFHKHFKTKISKIDPAVLEFQQDTQKSIYIDNDQIRIHLALTLYFKIRKIYRLLYKLVIEFKIIFI
jgi:hypothetical protein